MIVVKREKLAALFRALADNIELGDSDSGTITYDAIGWDGAPELGKDELLLRASYRLGNLLGQGSMVVLE